MWEKEGVNNDSKILSPIYWKNEVSIDYDGEDYKKNKIKSLVLNLLILWILVDN